MAKLLVRKTFFCDLRTKDTDNLSFKKFGRTTGLTEEGRIDNRVKDLFVRMFDIDVAEDDQRLPELSDIPYTLCNKCKDSVINGNEIPHDRKVGKKSV